MNDQASSRLNYCRRLIGTAIAFSSFGLGGALLGVIFPLVNLATPREERGPRARRTIHGVFITFMRMMRALGIMEWEIDGAERLGRSGQLVIANHPSLLDVVFMMAHIDEPNCVVKGALFRNPFTRGPVSAAGYIANDSSEQMLNDGIVALERGDCLIMFPEGTRTKPNEGIVLHRGAAAMAIKAATILTPVVITVSPTTLTKNEKWYRIPARRFKMTLRVAADIDLAQYRAQNSTPIAARRLNADLTDFYTRECCRG